MMAEDERMANISTKVFLSLIGLGLMNGSAASAKELTSRLGVGYRNCFVIDLPSVSAIYYPSSELGIVGALGVDTEDQASRFGVQVGLRKIIFKEEKMNFFMGTALAMTSRESAGQTDSGFALDAVVGSEFFLPGLDSLGWNIETGISVSNVRRVRFRTLADHMLRAGMVFYF
jgi:hypothetical protein